MVLSFANGKVFADAWTPYEYRPATYSDSTNRIIIPIEIEGFSTSAFIDTASPYVVCSPEVAEVLAIDPLSAIEKITYNIRGNRVRGGLHRLSITLLAQKGNPLFIESSVFVPHDIDRDVWDNYPTVIGLITFLDSLRFAIDSFEQKFYFALNYS
jgi:hypothetical protein